MEFFASTGHKRIDLQTFRKFITLRWRQRTSVLNRPLPSEIGIDTVALKVGIPQLLFLQFHTCCKEIIWSLDWKLMACRLANAGS
jgi:hypothetical protein